MSVTPHPPACAAMDRAARERQAAANAVDDKDDAHSISTDASLPDGEGDLNGAMLLHEAAVVLNLHTQVVTVQSIRSLIPVVLDTNSGNYSRWREQFLLTLGRYQL